MGLSTIKQIPNLKEPWKENVDPIISCPNLEGPKEIINTNISHPVLKRTHEEKVDSSSSHHPIDLNRDDESELEPHGIFVYGTLMAEEFLFWVLTGTFGNYNSIVSLRQHATLSHYRHVAVNHGDYPALISGDVSDKVEGFLINPSNKSQRKKMDDFEGENYSRQCVDVKLAQSGLTVRACVYVWQDSLDKLLPYRDWSFSFFKEHRLQDWIDLFDGMELCGDD